MLLPDFVDSVYSQFTGKRSTSDLFSLVTTGDDTLRMIPDFLRDFGYVAIFWVLVSYSIIYVYIRLNRRQKKTPAENGKIWVGLIKFVFVILLWVLCFRGTGMKPASLNTAMVYTKPAGVNLVLNSSFTILNTIGKEYLPEKKYMENNEALKYFNPQCSYNKSELKTDNVVIIIFESLASEYCGFINKPGYTPFLDSLFEHSLVFVNNLSNGKKSPEALPSLFAGIPTLFDQPYTSSQYVNNKILSLPELLKRYNYHTAFFHGGKNGTMGFDLFAKVAGFEEYYGLDEYPDKSHFDGNWGVWDDKYLQYYANKMSEFKQPFITAVFTLSSHHPYAVPEKYEYLPSGPYEIHKPIGYTDECLRQFFNTAKKTDWYSNTLFIITGDHTSLTSEGYYLSRTGTYRVPLAFFHPSDTTLKGRQMSVSQHSDVFPTVVNYLGMKDTIITFGKSLLDKNEHFAVNYLSGLYWICDGQHYLLFDGEKSLGMYKFPYDVNEAENLLLLQPEKSKKLEMTLKSIIQQYNYRIRNNKLAP